MKLKSMIVTGVMAGSILLGGQMASASGGYDPNSLVDTMKTLGMDSSFKSRNQLAQKHSIGSYIGSENQNIALLGAVKGKAPVQVKESKPVTQKKVEAASTKSEGKTLVVTATAYTAYCEGCSGTTKTGIDLRANPNQKVIAVDPNVIPLGSKVHVEGYGTAIAGDIGGAIKGHRIDVFIPNKSDALEFGRKKVEVKVLN